MRKKPNHAPSDPLISIVTITFNAEKVIEPTMKSVAEQTFQDFEHIIIDGASDDDTLDKVAKIPGNDRRKVVSEPDNGIYDAMNKGLGLAKGDYVIFLNAGDAFHKDTTLQTIADCVLDNDYPGIAYGQTQIVDSERHRIGDRHLTAPAQLTLDSFKYGMVVCHQAFVVLRKLVDNYDTRYKYSADYEWCIRCLQRSHRTVYIDQILIDYLKEGVTTANHAASLWETFRIMSYYYGLFPTI